MLHSFLVNLIFLTLKVSQPSNITIANNYYQNITVDPTFLLLDFFSAVANVTVANETVVNSTLDDLYTF